MSAPGTARALGGLAALLWLASGAPAFAQQGAVDEAEPAEPAPAARRWIEEGIARREAGEDVEALALFERAFERSASPEAEVQIALAQQALGRWAESEAHLAAALAVIGDAWIDTRRSVLEAELAAIRGHLGRLDVVGTAGARVVVDGREVGDLPLRAPIYLPPGHVDLLVAAPGFHRVERRVEILAGVLARESTELRPVDAEPQEAAGPAAGSPSAVVAPPTEAEGSAPVSALGAVSLGLAAGGLAAGVALAVFREERAAHWNSDTCLGRNPTITRMDNCGSVLDEISAAEVGLTVGFVGAGAFLALGVTLLVVDSLGDSEQAAFRCSPGPGDLGLACGARF